MFFSGSNDFYIIRHAEPGPVSFFSGRPCQYFTCCRLWIDVAGHNLFSMAGRGIGLQYAYSCFIGPDTVFSIADTAASATVAEFPDFLLQLDDIPEIS